MGPCVQNLPLVPSTNLASNFKSSFIRPPQAVCICVVNCLTAEEEMIDQISLRHYIPFVYFWSGTNNGPLVIQRF